MRNAATAVLVLAVAVGGCSFGLKRNEAMVEPQANWELPPPRLAEPKSEEPTLVDRLIDLQQKYAQAVQDLSNERDNMRQLSDEKRGLAEQIAVVQAELARAQKELQEANDLLITVRQENEKWKADVLAHRTEILLAHKTEMEALVKVLRLLGGEFTQPTPPATTSTNTSAASTQAPASAKDEKVQETKGAEGETAG